MEEELIFQILSTFGHVPTNEQQKAVETFARFYLSVDDHSVMLLRGSAGTGKTSIAAAMVQTLVNVGRRVVLLAPTGRAAKVFWLTSNHPAATIHRHIYRQRTATEDAVFNLNINLHQNTLFIVDEASMIANDSMSDAQFGSGRLLDDLVKYVYNGKNCRLMLIGDKAQLPPVGLLQSPALMPDYIAGYGLRVFEADINEVVRQSVESGILYNATIIRSMATRDHEVLMPKVTLKGFADIVNVEGYDLIEMLENSYRNVGLDETIVVTRSNKAAVQYNDGIRYRVLDREEEVSSGDYLMVVRNKYISLDNENEENIDNQHPEQQKPKTFFIANGDRVKVRRVKHTRELYGFHFAELTVEFPDYDNMELELTTILDTLHSNAPALTEEQHKTLYQQVMEDYADIPRKTDRIKKIREDKHYNAMQVKYAYAVTCHKAQGGQWAHVYVDQGFINQQMLTEEYFHWLYTAFTRATERLFLINWQKEHLIE